MMQYSFMELAEKFLRKYKLNAYLSQKNGYIHWMWMGGENNSAVDQGSMKIVNLFTIRKLFAHIRQLECDNYFNPQKPINVRYFNILLEMTARKYAPNQLTQLEGAN